MDERLDCFESGRGGGKRDCSGNNGYPTCSECARYLLEDAPELKSGARVELTRGARWTNSIGGEVVTRSLPAGTMVTLMSWRPEGWLVKTDDGSSFFVFEDYLK